MCRKKTLQGCCCICFGFGLLVGHALESWFLCSGGGLALLFLALCLNLVKVEQVKDVGGFLTSLLPLLFVSPTVGIVDCWGWIQPQLLSILLLLVASTALTFGVSGLVTQAFSKKRRDDHG